MDTWCVYVREPVVVFTSDARGSRGIRECEAEFQRRWAGRVSDPPQCHAAKSKWPATLLVTLWNLRREHIGQPEAAEYQAGVLQYEKKEPADVRLVVRGSEQEVELLEYGEKMLRRLGQQEERR